ncbi:MAG: hypothetical protein HY717_11135 [Planctomycetes bacterium]|nr:hypothetical protein [Planctomycetota bacterium]
MARKKIPLEAFDFYWKLGPRRSYQAVADHYGASKRAVTLIATKERWKERLEKTEREASEKLKDMAVETIEAVNRRHLKVARLIQIKALEALKHLRFDSALSAVEALDKGLLLERQIKSDPSERTSMSDVELTRREYERWMTPAAADDEKPVVSGE